MTSIASIPQYCSHMRTTTDFSFTILALTIMIFDSLVLVTIIVFNTYMYIILRSGWVLAVKSTSYNLIVAWRYPGRWFQPPEPTRTDEKWLVFRPVPDGSPVFPTASGRKSHGIMEAVFRTDSIVPENGKIRRVPFVGFYLEARGIRAGNQSEINVSLRNLTGKVRIAAGCQLKNTGFRGTLI